jgi:hypothetical protein
VILRPGQDVQEGAPETAHCQVVIQESLKVALVQAGGNFLEQRLVQHESVQVRSRNRSRGAGLDVGIVQNGKQGVGGSDGAGPVQMRAQRGERFRKL